jgi:hypothetical protein
MRIDVADVTGTAAHRILTDAVAPRPVAWVAPADPPHLTAIRDTAGPVR